MSEHLSGDRPISHPEDDAFGVSSFANALATSVLQMNTPDGLVISVEGPWGTGKSSALALSIRAMKLQTLSSLGYELGHFDKVSLQYVEEKWNDCADKRRIHIVRFNPWNFSGQENLVRAFFRELASQIDVEPEGRLKKALNRLAGYLPAFVGSVAAGSVLLAGPMPAASAAGMAGRAAGEAVERAFRSEASLEELKTNLDAALREAANKIIVIIDDLDRLLPLEMRSIFSLVKSLGDLPNVVYILSFDEIVVKNSLNTGAEKIEPTFLDKIVQVSLKLPPPWQGELRNLFFKRLNPIIGDAQPADIDRWHRVFLEAVQPYLETPRDVIRLANTLAIIWPNVVGDVDLTDLIALTTLQLFDPTAYELITDHIEALTHSDFGFESDDELGRRLEPSSANRLEVAKVAMAFLFPRLDKAWNKFARNSDYYIVQREQRRISTKEYHRNYFIFGRDTRMLSRRDLEAVILDPKSLSAVIASLEISEGTTATGHPSKIATLLNQLSECVYVKPVLSTDLLKSLLDCSAALIRREDAEWDFFYTDNTDRIETIIRFGILKIKAEDRSDLLQILTNYKEGLQVRADVVERDARNHGLFGGDEKIESELLFTKESVAEAAALICGQIVHLCKSGAIWREPRPMRLIWAWKRMSSEGTLEQWIDQVLADDELIVRLANALPGQTRRSSARGNEVVQTFCRANYKDFFDVDVLFARLEELAERDPAANLALENLRAAEAATRD